jgi:uncharacterized protein
MDVTPAIPGDRFYIDSYGPGRFQVSRQPYAGSILVFPDLVIPWGGVTDFADLSVDAFAPMLSYHTLPEFVLLGCGARMQPVPSELKRMLREAGLVIEPMDTGAACRSYNVLLSEQRRVCAALIALPV